jgi:hypothetical protein
MTRIVTTAYRPRRPPKKRKAVALQGPAIVRKAKAAKGVHTADTPKPGQAPPPPANDDRKPVGPNERNARKVRLGGQSGNEWTELRSLDRGV